MYIDSNNNTSDSFVLYGNSSSNELFRITDTGYVGIGTTSPYTKLSIHANNGETNTSLFTIASSTASATTTLFTVLNNGNVGIGTSNPTSPLTVNSGDILAYSGYLRAANAGNMRAVIGGSDAFMNMYNSSTVLTNVISTNGASYINGGNLGIGTTSPYSFLSISNSATTAINTPLFTIASTTAGNSTTTLMTVLANGYVGIGTNNPQYALDVGAGVFTTTRLGTLVVSPPGHINTAEYISGNTNMSMGSRGSISLIIDSNNNDTTSAFTIAGNTSSSEVFRVSDVGYVGIGTTSPYTKLSIHANNGETNTSLFTIASSTASATTTLFTVLNNGNVGIGTDPGTWKLLISGGDLAVASGGNIRSGGNFNIAGSVALDVVTNDLRVGPSSGFTSLGLYTNTARRLSIDSVGNVGIGTTTPNWSLQVASSTPYIALTDTDSTANAKHLLLSGVDGIFRIGTGNDALTSTSTFFTIAKNGYVGIGTTPASPLDVNGAISTNSSVLFASSRGVLASGSGTDAKYYSGNVGGDFYILPNNTYGTVFKYNGNVGIGTTSPFALFAIAASSTNAGNTSLFAISTSTASATSTAFIVDSNGKVGIGTSSPYAQLSVQGLIAGQYLSADSTTSTSTLAGGLDVGQGNLVYDFTTGITSVNALETGNLNFDTDAGAVSWADLPISSAPLNAVQSYTAQIGGTGVLTIYGLSNGSGGVATTSVAIGTSTPYTAGLTVWGRDVLSTTRVVDVVNNASTSLLTVYNGGAVSIGGSTSTTTISGYLDVLGTGANATSTFSSNLWVKGTLRSNLSYVGDLIFANDFTFTESLPINSSTTQALYLNNQRGDRLLAIDENGNLNIAGDICAKNFTCFNASLDKLNTDIGNLASSTDSLTKTTSSVQTLADAIVALDLKVDAFIASSTVDIGSIIASSTALLTSNTDFQNAIASSSANILASNDTFIQMVSNTVKNILASAQDWVVEKFTAKVAYLNRVEAETVAISKGMEIVDQSTGSVWCVTIKNGDWNKVQGSCSNIASSTIATPYPTPVVPTPTPVVSIIPVATTTSATTTDSTATSTDTTTSTTSSTVPSDVGTTDIATSTTPVISTDPSPSATPSPTSSPVPEISVEPNPTEPVVNDVPLDSNPVSSAPTETVQTVTP
jgi:hypothetical protein